MKDPYKILGVDKDASLQDIKKAYRGLAKKYHPDANSNNEKATELFKEITEAYKILSDETLKSKYEKNQKMKDKENIKKQNKNQNQSTSSETVFTGNPYEEVQNAFSKFFKFNPNGTEQELERGKQENPMNTDNLFEAFFKPGNK